MNRIWKEGEKAAASYDNRNTDREKTLITSIMSMVGYFMSLGDTQDEANIKVSDLSDEVSDKLYIYVLGNCQPLRDGINNSQLIHMNQAAKDYLINLLTPVV